MDTIKVMLSTIKSVFLGIGVWIVLIMFNTRSGEPGLNTVKMILDIMLAALIVKNIAIERKVAIGAAVLSAVITFLEINPLVEFLLLMVVIIAGGTALFYFSSGHTPTDAFVHERRDRVADFPGAVAGYWEEKNRLNPWFEQYSYSSEEGVSIKKGFLSRTYINIPTNHTRMRIDQSVFQRMVGLCDVSFFNNFNGELYGDEILHNIKIQSAQILRNMI